MLLVLDFGCIRIGPPPAFAQQLLKHEIGRCAPIAAVSALASSFAQARLASIPRAATDLRKVRPPGARCPQTAQTDDILTVAPRSPVCSWIMPTVSVLTTKTTGYQIAYTYRIAYQIAFFVLIRQLIGNPAGICYQIAYCLSDSLIFWWC